jgi:hypothetical protein
MDGATLDVPDTADDDEFFGRPSSGRGERKGASPQVRLVGVAECGTHALFAAEIGLSDMPERTLATHLLSRVGAGMLLMADRGFTSYDLWRQAAATGADLLWRASSVFSLPVLQKLPDGSYLSHPAPATSRSPCGSSSTPSATIERRRASTTGWSLALIASRPSAPFGWLDASSPSRPPFSP